jgi:hypothetical protein
MYFFISNFKAVIHSCVAMCSSRERSEQSLVTWATPQLHDIDALAKMVDPAMDGMYPAKSLSRFADIIALCVQVIFVIFRTFLCPAYDYPFLVRPKLFLQLLI